MLIRFLIKMCMVWMCQTIRTRDMGDVSRSSVVVQERASLSSRNKVPMHTHNVGLCMMYEYKSTTEPLAKETAYIYIYTNTHVCIDNFAYSSPHLGSTLGEMGEKRNTPASGNDNSWCFRLVVKPPTVGRGKGMSPWRYARQNTSTKLDQRDKPWTDKPRTITHKERSKWRVSSLKSWEIYTINTEHNCY